MMILGVLLGYPAAITGVREIPAQFIVLPAVYSLGVRKAYYSLNVNFLISKMTCWHLGKMF